MKDRLQKDKESSVVYSIRKRLPRGCENPDKEKLPKNPRENWYKTQRDRRASPSFFQLNSLLMSLLRTT